MSSSSSNRHSVSQYTTDRSTESPSSPEDVAVMRSSSATIPLSLAIFNQQGRSSDHWALFIDGDMDSEKLLFQATGSYGHYQFEYETRDARQDPKLLKMVPLFATVTSEQIAQIIEIASAIPMKNDELWWSGQDYVTDLLNALEDAEIIDEENDDYLEQKGEVLGMQHGSGF
ncbi:MAG: hypothetical protein M1819_001619 [Sarea resinae]|nr:MAG: hypothetical protein M1819_001619 [Sarea resinae]